MVTQYIIHNFGSILEADILKWVEAIVQNKVNDIPTLTDAQRTQLNQIEIFEITENGEFSVFSPLQLAIRNGSCEGVKCLLGEFKSDSFEQQLLLSQIPGTGHSSMEWAVTYKQNAVVRLLSETYKQQGPEKYKIKKVVAFTNQQPHTAPDYILAPLTQTSENLLKAVIKAIREKNLVKLKQILDGPISAELKRQDIFIQAFNLEIASRKSQQGPPTRFLSDSDQIENTLILEYIADSFTSEGVKLEFALRELGCYHWANHECVKEKSQSSLTHLKGADKKIQGKHYKYEADRGALDPLNEHIKELDTLLEANKVEIGNSFNILINKTNNLVEEFMEFNITGGESTRDRLIQLLVVYQNLLEAELPTISSKISTSSSSPELNNDSSDYRVVLGFKMRTETLAICWGIFCTVLGCLIGLAFGGVGAIPGCAIGAMIGFGGGVTTGGVGYAWSRSRWCPAWLNSKIIPVVETKLDVANGKVVEPIHPNIQATKEKAEAVMNDLKMFAKSKIPEFEDNLNKKISRFSSIK